MASPAIPDGFEPFTPSAASAGPAIPDGFEPFAGTAPATVPLPPARPANLDVAPAPMAATALPLPPPRPADITPAAQPADTTPTGSSPNDPVPASPLVSGVPLPPPRPDIAGLYGNSPISNTPSLVGKLAEKLGGPGDTGMLTGTQAAAQWAKQKTSADAAIKAAQDHLADVQAHPEKYAGAIATTDAYGQQTHDTPDDLVLTTAQDDLAKAKAARSAIDQNGPPTMTTQRQVLEAGGRAAADAAVSTAAGIGRLALGAAASEPGTTAADIEPVTKTFDGLVDKTRKAVKEAFQPDEAKKGELSSRAAELVGGLAPLFAGGFAAKAIGIAPAAANALMFAGQGGEEQYEATRAKDPDGYAKWGAYAAGLGIGAVASTPLTHMLTRMDQASAGGLGKMVGEIAKTGGEQAVYGFLSAVANNAVAQHFYDPTRDITSGAVESAITQAIVGASLHGASAVGRVAQAAGAAAPGPTATPDQIDAFLHTARSLNPDAANSRAARAFGMGGAEAMGTLRLPAPGEGATPRAAPAGQTPADTGLNVPETPETLAAQRKQLADGDRAVQMFPAGTKAPPPPAGMKSVQTDRGTFHYNPDQITPDQIRSASEAGRENDILGLGPFNKADVAATGEAPVAVTERAPDGTEVRAAAAAPSQAPTTAAAMDAGKSDGNTVQVEPVEGVVAARTAKALPPEEVGLAKAAGYDVDTIAEMSTKERKRIAQQARASGLTPADLTDEERASLTGDGTRAAPVKAATTQDVDRAAAQVKDPTPAQAEAGNYKKGHLDFQGLPVTIETPAGAERRGIGDDGKPWAHTTDSHYGYIKGTTGTDGDHVDTYVGPNPQSDSVTIVDQIDPKTGKYDEHKVILGADNQAQALDIYHRGFNDGSGPSRVGGITTTNMAGFKQWLANGDHTKPGADQPRELAPAIPAGFEPVDNPAGNSAPVAEAPDARPAGDYSLVPNADEPRSTPGTRHFDIVKNGNVVGAAHAELNGNEARFHNVYFTGEEPGDGGANKIGTAGMASLARQFRDLHPEITKLTGFRVSGARGARGGSEAKVTAAPRSLATFLASRGGLAPHPDLTHMGIDTHFVPGHGRLVRKKGGMTLDKAREAAVEAGYLPEADADALATSTPNDLLNALDEEARGRRQFRAGDELAAADHAAAARAKRNPGEEEHRARQDIIAMLEDAGLPARHLDDDALDRASKAIANGDEHDMAHAYERAVMQVSMEHENLREAAATTDHGIAPEWLRSEPPEGWNDDETVHTETEAGPRPSLQAGDEGDGEHAARAHPETGERPDGAGAPATEAGERPRHDGDQEGASSEVGADGKPQTVLPGAERISDRELAQRKADEREPTPKPGERRQIGINDFGHPVFEDHRGVRSYVADGIRMTEKVRLEPGGGYSINKSERTDAFKTAEESAAERAVVAGRSMRENIEAWKAEDRTWAEVLHALGGADALSTADLTEAARLWNKGGETPADVPAAKANSLSDAFADHFAGKKGFRTIIEARRFAKEHDGTTDAKAVEEALEAGLVKAGRGIVAEAKTPAQAFNRLLAMYERQPTLGTRTSTSVKNQAYSTPLPLAYLAAKLAGIAHGTTVYEPTAGNGALLMTADPGKVLANEINPDRRAALEAQGFRVSDRDGALPPEGGPFAAVIANPPFGPVKENGVSKRFDMGDVQPGYSTNEIDHVIALRALDAMDPRGRGVLIIGAPNGLKDRAEGYNGKAKREFNKVLYDRYNVVDHFTVSGDLYAKQGAGWPVDVIVIDGKGASARRVPAADVPPVLSTWDQVKEKLNGAPANATTRIEQAGGAPFVPDATRAPAADAGDRPADDGGRRADVKPAPDSADVVRPGRDREQPGSGAVDAGAGRSEERPVRVEPDRVDRQAPAARRTPAVADGENARQVAYQPGSTKTKSLGTLVPVNMKSSINDALESVRERRGDLDHYVGKSLGMKRGESLGDYFGAEQVDALALAIDNIERGAALIIGDQTGIGKGRVNAGIIRYAIAQGRIPIFFTEKSGLYASMYDDLTDIGIQKFLGREPNILATDAALNQPRSLENMEGERLKTPDATAHNAALRDLAATGGIGDHDMVFTTYSGSQTIGGAKTDRQRFLEAIAHNSIPIMDESHNAGGAGPAKDGFGNKKVKDGQEAGLNRAAFLRSILDKAPAAFYSSATYAKRPDVMDLYRKTDMRLAVANIEELGEAIAAGGVPMQQVIAADLARAGQYIRRERSFDGISYDVAKIPVDRDTYDGISRSLAGIQNFAEMVGQAAKTMDKDLREDAARATQDGSVGGAGASSTNFTSIMHNLVGQMLLSIKAHETAARAVAHIKAGRKPVIALSNTMESFLSQFAEDMGLNVGDAVSLDFSNVLNRYLERSKIITIKKPFMKAGEKAEKKILTEAEMDPAMRAAYKAAAKQIASLDLGGLPISPIDFIKAQIQAAGYKVGEITGRDLSIDYTGGTPRLASRGSKDRSKSGRIRANKEFNDGALDAMILNQAGSTGISLHAGERFKDKRKRVMLIAQAAGDINTHMQMLGRVHRTGQVVPPSFEQLAADIPAETRPAAVLAKKMASLNANTTAARDSAFTSADVPDFMNAYGDKVAANVMRDEVEINEALGRPVSLDEKSGLDGAMRKLTGRIPLLPLAEQERLYGRLIDTYRDMIEQLDAAGQNTLEAKMLDLDAKLVSQAELKASEGPSPFQEAVTLNTFNIKRQGKPYTAREVLADVGRAIGESVDAGEPERTLATFAKIGARQSAEMVTAERKDFDAYRRAYLDDIKDPEREAAQRTKLNDIERQFSATATLTHPGARVRLTFEGGETMTAVALRTSQSKGTKNPLALGSWKVTLASPTDGRTLQFPYSQIRTDGGTPTDGQVAVSAPGWEENAKQTLDNFDKLAAGGAREERVIATGNILAAFSKVRGQIVNFTTDKGEVRQGIMLAAKKTMDDVLSTMKKELKAPEEVQQWLRDNRGTPLVSTDGQVTMVLDRAGYTTISVPKSKKEGGRYYLDDAVLAETGDFASRGGRMVTEIGIDRLAPAIKALQGAGARFEITAAPDDIKVRAASVQAEALRTEAKAPAGWGGIEGDGIERETTDLGGLKLTMFRNVSPAQRDAIAGQVAKIIAEVAPSNVTSHVVDEAHVDAGALAKGYGKTEQGDRSIGGVYFDTEAGKAAIVVAMNSPDHVNTAFHEAWHAVKAALGVSDAEQRVLDRERPRLYRLIQEAKPYYTDEDLNRMDQEEVEAQAAGSWGAGARTGQHFIVAKILEALSRLIQRTKNLLAGYGFRSYEDVFGAFTRGEMKARADARAATERPEIRAEAIDPRQQPARPEPPRYPVRERIADMLDAAVSPEQRTKVVERFQNFNVRMRDLKDMLEARRNSPFGDMQNFYEKKRLFPGRETAEVDAFNKAHLDPLIAAIKDSGMTLKEVGDALTALHAPERNAAMDKINQPGWYAEGRGSGMSNDEAVDVLARIQANGQGIALDKIADQIAAIREFSVSRMEESGLISEATANTWREQYENYVDLRGFEDAPEEDDRKGFGGKVDVRGSGVRRALGRSSRSENPVVNMIDQAYRTINRAERNAVLKSLYSALKGFRPSDVEDVVTFDKGDKKRIFDERTGMVREVADNSWRHEPGVVGVMIGGRVHLMRFRAPALAEAIKRTGADQLGPILGAVSNFQNLLKSLWTHYSPDFMLRHFAFRYPIEGALNQEEQKDWNPEYRTSQYVRDAIPFLGRASKAIFAVNRGEAGGEMGAHYREMVEHGGAMRFKDMRDINMLRAHLEKQLQDISSNPLRRAQAKARAAIEAMDTVTNALDNSLRLAAYAQARKGGKTPQQAAVIAREATVDFQQKGKWANLVSLWFPFGNTAIQTGVRMMSGVARSRKLRHVFLGTMAAGAAAALFNYLIGGDDTDGVPFIDKVPDWERRLAFVLVNPLVRDAQGRPSIIKIPMPYNWALPLHLGGAMVEGMMGHHRVGRILSSVMKSAIEVLTPFGQNDNMASMLAPEIAKMPLELRTNESYAGWPIHSDSSFDHRPHSQQGRASTGDGWKYTAGAINTATGGNANRPGMLDFYPEDIRYGLDHFIGTQRRMLMNIGSTATSVAHGEAPEAKSTPLLRVVTGTDYDAADRSAYFDASNEIHAAQHEVKNAQKSGTPGAAAEAVKRNAIEIQSAGQFNMARNFIKATNRTIAATKADASLSAKARDAKVKEIQDQQFARMKAVTAAYEKRKKEARR